MMRKLMARGEELAREVQRRRVGEVARQMAEIVGRSAIEVDEARVLVRGKGMIKRWLIDPQLRFLK